MTEPKRTAIPSRISISVRMAFTEERKKSERPNETKRINRKRTEEHLLLSKFADEFSPYDRVPSRISLRATQLSILAKLVPLSNLFSCG